MRKNYWVVLAMLMILPAMVLTVSCAKTAVESQPTTTETQETTQPAVQETTPTTTQQGGMTEEELRAQQAAQAKEKARNQLSNEDIYFEFDSATILPAGQQVLSMKADFMGANAGVSVTIQGHCDDRGTNAYNMALGQRRADAAKEFMVNLGIAAGRLNTISYGEEQPVDLGHNEEAWAKNRRAHFVID